jgi:hypothetical protein
MTSLQLENLVYEMPPSMSENDTPTIHKVFLYIIFVVG